MKLPNRKYNIIYADPPWKFSSPKFQDGNRGFGNRVEDHYLTMNDSEIKNIPVHKICKTDCILFFWTIDSKLKSAIEIIENWGFRYATIGFTWIKQYKSGSICYNFGTYTLKSSEICLIGIKGKLKNIKKKNNIKNLVFAERLQHSKKPNFIRNQIVELCGNLPRIELFAREKFEGWDYWGNELIK